jgi:hypothetical protein
MPQLVQIETMFLLFVWFYPAKALSDDLAANHLHGDRGPTHPHGYIYTIAWTTTQ